MPLGYEISLINFNHSNKSSCLKYFKARCFSSLEVFSFCCPVFLFFLYFQGYYFVHFMHCVSSGFFTDLCFVVSYVTSDFTPQISACEQMALVSAGRKQTECGIRWRGKALFPTHHRAVDYNVVLKIGFHLPHRLPAEIVDHTTPLPLDVSIPWTQPFRHLSYCFFLELCNISERVSVSTREQGWHGTQIKSFFSRHLHT